MNNTCRLTLLMVAIDNDTGKDKYIALEIDAEFGEIPGHNTEDIMKFVEMANEENEQPWTYCDMFGIIVDGEKQIWENGITLVDAEPNKDGHVKPQGIKTTDSV